MKSKICYIVGAGENCGIDFAPQQGDYVIAADGGLKYLEEAGISADLVIGDFDSLQEQPDHSNIIALKKEKDETDMYAAIQQGIKQGYQCFHLYGCTGGRIDHTIANMQLIAHLAQQKLQGFLFDKENVITAITDTTMRFPACDKGYISVFSHSKKAEGVSLVGLKYVMDKAMITNEFPIGVSNEFIGRESVITVERGTLLIVYPRNVMRKHEK